MVCQYMHYSHIVCPHELNLFYEFFFQGLHVPYVIHHGFKPIPCSLSQCPCKHIFEFIKCIDTTLSCWKCNIFFKNCLMILCTSCRTSSTKKWSEISNNSIAKIGQSNFWLPWGVLFILLNCLIMPVKNFLFQFSFV